MQRIALDAQAGQVSAELARRGIADTAQVHVLVDVIDPVTPAATDTPEDEWEMAAIAQAGQGFDWLADEPEIYSDADLVERAG